MFKDQDLEIDSKRLATTDPEVTCLENLQEIFLIYCRQHVMLGKHPTFEDIKKEVRNLNLGEFIKFCTDFAIPLSKGVTLVV